MKIGNLEIPKIAVIALIGLISGIVYIIMSAKHTAEIKPLREPAKKPFASSIAGVGIIEALNENIAVSPSRTGKIAAVYVQEGDYVKKGQPLFKLDDDLLNAELQTESDNARAQGIEVERLRKMPRNVDIPPLKAQVQANQADYKNAEIYYKRLKSLYKSGAVSENEYIQSGYAYDKAKATYEKSQSDLNKALAGAWSYEINEAQAKYAASTSMAKELQVQINKSTVIAPRNGQVLKINNRVGEYISLLNQDTDAPLILGSDKKLQVRTDIDEINASKFEPGATAIATIKGNANLSFPLKFVRVQPYMVPKKDLSGGSTERVDVRVLQVIYSFAPPKFPVYVGQQVDVYIDKKPITKPKK